MTVKIMTAKNNDNKALYQQIKSMDENFKEFRDESRDERKEFKAQISCIDIKLSDFILSVKTSVRTAHFTLNLL